METREVHDTMGSLSIPAAAYYGAQTARAVENFPLSGLKAHPELVRALAGIKIAAARANRSLGLLDPDRGRAIETAAREVFDGGLREQFVVDAFNAGAGTSMHMNANEVIAARACEILGGERGNSRLVHPNDHVNMGQSTNDVIPTATRIAALALLRKLCREIDGLAEALAERAGRFDHVIKSGRTHLQDAVAVRLGQEFGGYGA
jgi:aspartate ammonia-lyase